MYPRIGITIASISLAASIALVDNCDYSVLPEIGDGYEATGDGMICAVAEYCANGTLNPDFCDTAPLFQLWDPQDIVDDCCVDPDSDGLLEFSLPEDFKCDDADPNTDPDDTGLPPADWPPECYAGQSRETFRTCYAIGNSDHCEDYWETVVTNPASSGYVPPCAVGYCQPPASNPGRCHEASSYKIEIEFEPGSDTSNTCLDLDSDGCIDAVDSAEFTCGKINDIDCEPGDHVWRGGECEDCDFP